MKKFMGLIMVLLLVVLLAGCFGKEEAKIKFTTGRFNSTIKGYQKGKSMIISTNKMVMKGDKQCVETKMAFNIPGMDSTTINYMTPKAVYTYDSKSKMAYEIKIDRSEKEKIDNPLKIEAELKKYNAQKVGKEKINGQMCTKYKFNYTGVYRGGLPVDSAKKSEQKSEVYAWLRDKDQIPLKVKVVQAGDYMEIIYTKVEVGGKVSESEVTLPKGTKIVSQEKFMQERMKGFMKNYR
ncbi:MAG: hypothetical protein KKB81_05220 [Candidatus Margulisbacteria bacterium]|nr:hypothetical protein [Candidatus Margulisiibacteriota bacterium]MBU1021340.1 hypothetical protein [Candidatus Margulisiibacteriota bacterium]MBU1729171.1 hypothetical protein [Candidatus Margulisiibacteriota bacterium]MBU1954844.1 hypothetical protein [Candidatus Margulisiibacteriota bacterium]